MMTELYFLGKGVKMPQKTTLATPIAVNKIQSCTNYSVVNKCHITQAKYLIDKQLNHPI